MTLTYQDAGVNISEGDRFVRRIRKTVRSTFKKGVLSDIGGFGAFFDARFQGMRSPVLVSSVDGVGTKLIVAQMMRRYDTVGEDLVNHCVNDILVCGARPLYFMDYYATGALSVENAASVLEGFARGCRANSCALIGGETAEMPGLYEPHEFDLAGMIVGVAEKHRIIDGRRIRKGDVLIGLPSTGLHTNGYSLARASLLAKYSLDDRVEELSGTVGEALLAVHRSYLGVVAPLMARFDIRGLSHITGGGIVGNTNRILPRGRSLRIRWDAWQRPPLFALIQRTAGVPEDDMRRTFNLGIGMVLVVPGAQAGAVVKYLGRRKEPALVIGDVL
ncbi:MAG TPA: phosphoribosylformylglycinamidine cyclo-ligase [Bacteroidota bacterium]|nr:phosphoribosylformylglycinamidine cyclo-ligase [Bacteroidota bacterium]